MAISEILAEIDNEIAKLKDARALLSKGTVPAAKKSPGRPKNTTAAVAPQAAKPARKKKRKLTPEGRKRIREAVKKRWAAQKIAAAAAK